MDSQLQIVAYSREPCFSSGDIFPQEVLAEIAEYLSEGCHRKHLLNLSLASRTLRIEAQRVLFRGIYYALPKDYAVTLPEMVTHRLFLEAIINSPRRLALHVRTYTSRFLVLAPAHSDKHEEQCLTDSDDNYWAAGCELWNLTSRALPLMTRLKHLTLFLGTDWKYRRKGSEPSPFRGTSILPRCSFTLDSFSWAERHGLQNAVGDLEEFLCRQPHLQSLNLNTTHRNLWYTHNIPQFKFSPNSLPCLRRVLGSSSFLAVLLSESRRINTLFWLESSSADDTILGDEARKALQRVKCLVLPETAALNTICQSLSSIETLYLKQVPGSWHQDIFVLKHLKSLRTFIVDVNVLNVDSLNPQFNPPDTNPALRIAAAAFSVCADTLQSVHFPQRSPNLYLMLSVDRNGQYQMRKICDMSDFVQLFEPWIPRGQQLWADVEDYLW